MRFLTRLDRDTMLILALALAGAAFGLTSSFFLTVSNLLNIGLQSASILLVSLGMAVVVIAGGIDLAVGSLAALTGMIAVWLMTALGASAISAVTAALLIAAFIGATHGLIVVLLRVPGIIVTLGTLTALRGVASLMNGGSALRSTDAAFAAIAGGGIAGLPWPILIVTAVALLLHLVLAYTVLGRALYAVGGSAQVARSAGIPVGAVTVAAYTLSGLAAGVAGVLAASRTEAGSPIIGAGWELQAVVIAVLGGVNLFGGAGGILGVVVAGLLLAVVRNGLSLLGVASWIEGILIGSLLVAVVAINARRFRRGPTEVAGA